jgi:hypothetical protein
MSGLVIILEIIPLRVRNSTLHKSFDSSYIPVQYVPSTISIPSPSHSELLELQTSNPKYKHFARYISVRQGVRICFAVSAKA